MTRSRGNHLSEAERSALLDMIEARTGTGAIAAALGVTERTVQKYRDKFYAQTMKLPGSFLDECRSYHALLRDSYKEAIETGDRQHASAISRRMNEWKKRARTASNYERRAREAA